MGWRMEASVFKKHPAKLMKLVHRFGGINFFLYEVFYVGVGQFQMYISHDGWSKLNGA